MVKKLKTRSKVVIKQESDSEEEPEEKTLKFTGEVDEGSFSNDSIRSDSD